MVKLLTLYGIPPQVVAALTAEQIGYIESGLEEYVALGDDKTSPAAISVNQKILSVISDVTDPVVQSFTNWGAHAVGPNFVNFKYDNLSLGQTNFEPDKNLHSDELLGLHDLHEDNFLTLRVNIVSNTPSVYLDLTSQMNAVSFLRGYRQEGRVYKPELLDFARAANLVVRPNVWDALVYDTITPHLPEGVAEEMWRFIGYRWTQLKLPHG